MPQTYCVVLQDLLHNYVVAVPSYTVLRLTLVAYQLRAPFLPWFPRTYCEFATLLRFPEEYNTNDSAESTVASPDLNCCRGACTVFNLFAELFLSFMDPSWLEGLKDSSQRQKGTSSLRQKHKQEKPGWILLGDQKDARSPVIFRTSGPIHLFIISN